MLMTISGAYYSYRELIDFVKRDELYMRMTGNGVVFGDGEPLEKRRFHQKMCFVHPKTESGILLRSETSLQA